MLFKVLVVSGLCLNSLYILYRSLLRSKKFKFKLNIRYIEGETVRTASKPVTRINRNGDMWYTFVPKTVKQLLEQHEFKLKDYVIWEDVKIESDKEAVIVLRIVKSGVQE